MLPLPWSAIVALPVAYLCGSIPFALFVGQWVKGIDLRKHGSGNLGATNAGRVLGRQWGASVLILDALKGLLPTALLPCLALSSAQPHVQVGCGVAAILGHMFSCWIGFQGGKGVATSLGVVSILAPWSTVAALTMFGMTLLAFRYVSLSSILAAITFAVTTFLMQGSTPFDGTSWSLSLFSILVPLLVIFRHRGNILRLLKGQENRIGTGGRNEPPV